MKERALITTIFLSLTAAVLAIVYPDRRHTIMLIWVLALMAYGLLESNARTRVLVRERSRFERLLEDPVDEPLVPEDLKRLERALGWMTYEASYFDFRVRPILRRLIHHRVLERLGVDLNADPSGVVGRVDPEILDLASERKAAELYGARNIETPDIARMITRIEGI